MNCGFLSDNSIWLSYNSITRYLKKLLILCLIKSDGFDLSVPLILMTATLYFIPFSGTWLLFSVCLAFWPLTSTPLSSLSRWIRSWLLFFHTRLLFFLIAAILTSFLKLFGLMLLLACSFSEHYPTFCFFTNILFLQASQLLLSSPCLKFTVLLLTTTAIVLCHQSSLTPFYSPSAPTITKQLSHPCLFFSPYCFPWTYMLFLGLDHSPFTKVGKPYFCCKIIQSKTSGRKLINLHHKCHLRQWSLWFFDFPFSSV